MIKCRVCKKDLVEDYGVYENADYQKRYYCFTHWKKYYGLISQTSRPKRLRKVFTTLRE